MKNNENGFADPRLSMIPIKEQKGPDLGEDSSEDEELDELSDEEKALDDLEFIDDDDEEPFSKPESKSIKRTIIKAGNSTIITRKRR